MGHLELLASLAALGLTEADVDIVHMEVAAAYQAFLAGEGDMVCLWSTFASDGEEEGLVAVAGAEAAKLYVPSVILASDKAMEDEETTQKILNVMIRGFMWVMDHPDEAAEYYYNICEEEGVTCTEEYASDLINKAYGPRIDEYREMYENDEFTADLANVMKYYIAAGTYVEEDTEKVTSGFDGTMLLKALGYYDENYAGLDE